MDNAPLESFAVLGAASLVGTPLIARLVGSGRRVLAYSRRSSPQKGDGAEWRGLADAGPEPVNCWISVAPVWVLPEHYGLIEASGAKRLVQLSSTSRFTKARSSDTGETALAQRFIDSEAALVAWCEAHGIAWTILRPTLIYSAGRDRNVTEIARTIRRFGFFPLFGKAGGLRQPVAAADVAAACVLAADADAAHNRAYEIGGGEMLSYRAMVGRIFAAMGRRPITPTVPLGAFRLALAVLKLLPRYRKWTPAMAERMNADMVFDNGPATRDFGYTPQRFDPGPL